MYSNFVLGELRRNRETSYYAGQVHRLRQTPDGLKMSYKKIMLVKNNDLRKAGRLLEKLYVLNPHPDVAEAYVHLRHGDSALERLSRAEVLAKSVAGHEDSVYCLAKAELEAHHFIDLVEGGEEVRTVDHRILAHVVAAPVDHRSTR